MVYLIYMRACGEFVCTTQLHKNRAQGIKLIRLVSVYRSIPSLQPLLPCHGNVKKVYGETV